MKWPLDLKDEDVRPWLRQAMQNRLTMKENLQAVEYTIADTGVANGEISVRHALGKTPRQYIYNVSSAAIVYDSRRSEWNEQVMYLKCNTGNVTIYLTIL